MKNQFLIAILLVTWFQGRLLPAGGTAGTTQSPGLACRFEDSQVLAGEKTVLFLELQEISDLYGYQLELQFPAEKVALLDGNPAGSGINFKLGDFLSPDFVVINEVDGAAGRASLALSQMNPSEPGNGGGILAQIEVQAQEAGEVRFTFNNVILVNTSAEAIAHSLQGCALQVLPGGGAVQTASPTLAPPATTAAPKSTRPPATLPATQQPALRSGAAPGGTEPPHANSTAVERTGEAALSGTASQEPAAFRPETETAAEDTQGSLPVSGEPPERQAGIPLALFGAGALVLAGIAFVLRKLR